MGRMMRSCQQQLLNTFSVFKKSQCLRQISRSLSTVEAEVCNAGQVRVEESDGETKKAKIVRKKREDRHVTDVACAESICQLLPKNCEYVLEGNPGTGVLTEALLRTNDKLKVRAFDFSLENIAPLIELRKKYGESRLQVIKNSLWHLSSNLYKDRVYGTTYIHDIFKDLPTHSWNDDPPFVMVGPVPTSMERNFMGTLPPLLVEKLAMFAFGRAQLMIYVSHHTYRMMTATRKDSLQIYHKISVLFNLLFDVELLAKESLTSFSVMGRTDQKIMVHKKYDESHLYLVRVTPKPQLPFQLPSNVSLRELQYFVRQTFSNRTAFVIDKLDTFIPRVGPRLIQLGYTTTTRFGDLDPVEVAHLFREFSSWPEYQHSHFKTLAQAAQEQFDSTAGKD